ncbi:hypothetical protein HPP92_009770 [Vanilla planifolia]|uniref:Uncharacterized protein n=1 Tax=Vanilla planifolia TaxID=51239 RepID=A0A835R4V2_VANPL|nr:hypothetical protein HPP92_009770 [Vanilla planifolia]
MTHNKPKKTITLLLGNPRGRFASKTPQASAREGHINGRVRAGISCASLPSPPVAKTLFDYLTKPKTPIDAASFTELFGELNFEEKGRNGALLRRMPIRIAAALHRDLGRRARMTLTNSSSSWKIGTGGDEWVEEKEDGEGFKEKQAVSTADIEHREEWKAVDLLQVLQTWWEVCVEGGADLEPRGALCVEGGWEA